MAHVWPGPGIGLMNDCVFGDLQALQLGTCGGGAAVEQNHGLQQGFCTIHPSPGLHSSTLGPCHPSDTRPSSADSQEVGLCTQHMHGFWADVRAW